MRSNEKTFDRVPPVKYSGSFVPLLMLAGMMIASVPPVSYAQSGADRRMVDEIIVTATRREQSLQDVPVSVAVVTAEDIRELSIQNLDQLSAYVVRASRNHVRSSGSALLVEPARLGRKIVRGTTDKTADSVDHTRPLEAQDPLDVRRLTNHNGGVVRIHGEAR
jgi:outer membrane receptor protein involved in Fe transport